VVHCNQIKRNTALKTRIPMKRESDSSVSIVGLNGWGTAVRCQAGTQLRSSAIPSISAVVPTRPSARSISRVTAVGVKWPERDAELNS
jgi:hypothetical protein